MPAISSNLNPDFILKYFKAIKPKALESIEEPQI
jgi:hypothetical protein